MYNIITSKENENIKKLVKLIASASERRVVGLFVVETPKLALDINKNKPNLVKEVYYTEEALEKTPRLAKIVGEHYIISSDVAKKLSGQKSTSGVYLVADMPNIQELPVSYSRYICLEEIQDPANVGAILRTAVAFGFECAAITQNSADPFSQKALRASMGAALKIDIFITDDLPKELKFLQKEKISVIATTLQNAKSITSTVNVEKIAVCIGNEGNGLSDEVTQMANERIFIPMQSNTESLNAAAAAAIFMWHFRRGNI